MGTDGDYSAAGVGSTTGSAVGTPSGPSHSSWGRRLRFVLAFIWTVVVLGCVAGILLLHFQAGNIDYAVVNLLTIALAFVVVLALVGRLFFQRRAHWLVRWLPVAVVLLAIASAFGLLRVDRVSGRMVPKLTWRWAAKPDQLLATRTIADHAAVDLKTTTPGDFPQFLGPRRDLVVTGIVLDRDWAAHPPKQVWRQEIGAAWSGFSAVNGYAVTMEQRGSEELVTCLEIATGKPCWTHAVETRHETVAGGVGPRCTPTIDDGLVYAQGATGIVRCLDGATGELLWSDNILSSIGVTPDEDLRAVGWGRSGSPLVVGDLLIVPFGGPKGGPYASLVAYDKKTGEVRWKGGSWQVSYASPEFVELCGVPQVVIVNESNVSGHRPEDGTVLWSHPWPGHSAANATVSQAAVVADNRLLLSKDYGTGAALIELAPSANGEWQVIELWAKAAVLKTKFTNVFIRDGFAYGLSDGILECIEVDSGNRRWKDRRAGNFGPGQILLVGDVILVQAESGEVVMVEANPEALVVLGRIPALSDQTWNNLCLYGRYLLVRNSVEAACYELPLGPGLPQADATR